MNFVLEIDEESASRMLGNVVERAGDLRVVFGDIVKEIEEGFEDAFGGTPDLVRTGDIRDALTSSTAGSSAGAVRQVGLDELVRGTSVWYAVFHKERLLSAFGAGEGERWARMIGDFIVQGRGLGFGLGL